MKLKANCSVAFSDSVKYEFNQSFVVGEEAEIRRAWEDLLARKLLGITKCLWKYLPEQRHMVSSR